MRPARRARRRPGAVEDDTAVNHKSWGLFLLLLMTGCGARPASTLGVAPDTRRVVAIKEIMTPAASGSPVTLRGTMVEKCPVAACWFRLRDKTGIVKVDVKAANFTVGDVPVNATVTVTGTPTMTKGGEPYLDATGLAYQ